MVVFPDGFWPKPGITAINKFLASKPRQDFLLQWFQGCLLVRIPRKEWKGKGDWCRRTFIFKGFCLSLYFYYTICYTIFKALSILYTSLTFSSSVTWTYKFIVIPTLTWPKITCIVLGRIPPSIHLIVIVCLRSYTVTFYIFNPVIEPFRYRHIPRTHWFHHVHLQTLHPHTTYSIPIALGNIFKPIFQFSCLQVILYINHPFFDRYRPLSLSP